MNRIIKITLVSITVGLLSCSLFKKEKAQKEPVEVVKQSATSVQWTDFTTGYEQAKTKKKLLLVDVYTDWCGWCKVMDKKTYTNQTVMDELANNYICVKLNPEKNVNYTMDGTTYTALEIKNILSENRQDGYPSTYFMNPSKSKQVQAVVGYVEATQFITYLTVDIPNKLR